MTAVANQSNKSVIWREVLLLWLVVLLGIRLVVFLQASFGLYEAVLVLVPLLFMYGPSYALKRSGEDDGTYPIWVPQFRDWPRWRAMLKINAGAAVLISLPFFGLYHLYQTKVFGYSYTGNIPPEPLMLIGYHLFFVAIPEEIFYRGYMQTRLNGLFGKKWRVLGVQIGMGAVITSLLFAFGHSIVHFQWWHFSIFFPSLVFCWMREKSGGFMAGALFHAWSNVSVNWLDHLYGIIVP